MTGSGPQWHVAECLLPGAQASPVAAKLYEHPSRVADVLWQGQVVGRVFELHPIYTEGARAAMLDVNLALDGFPSVIVHNLSRHSRGIEEGLGIERREGSVGFRFFDFHFQLETPRRHGRFGPSPY